MSKKEDAKNIINAFKARSGGGNLWKGMDRSRVANGALARIEDPDTINQREATLCGPAAFVHAIALDSPVDYANAIVHLFEDGRATLGGRGKTLVLKPSSDLLNYQLPATSEMLQADWIILASLRDSERWFFSYSSVTDRGSTTPGELADWFEKAGYSDVREQTSAVFAPLFSWAQEASDLFRKGYKVCLNINTHVLYTEHQNESSWKAGHFVGLASPITINDQTIAPFQACYYEGRHRECSTLGGGYDWDASTVSLKVFTWGELRNVPESGTLSARSFMKSFYGYVAGKY
jgi:hypothetical protein